MVWPPAQKVQARAMTIRDHQKERGRSAKSTDDRCLTTDHYLSLFASLVLCRSCRSGWSRGVDLCDGSIGSYEGLCRDAPDVAFGDFVHAIELPEQLTPVAIAGLSRGKRVGEALVIRESAQQVSTGSRFVHCEFGVGHIRCLQLVDLFVDRCGHF